MKFRFIYALLLLVLALFVLQSRSSGAAATGLGDRTGSPLSGGAGCSCHGGASYAPSISVEVKDAFSNPVTEYQPGQSYTIEYTVSAASGSPGGFGFQSVAISNQASALNAGNMISTVTVNTRISSFNGRQYAEHNGVNNAGVFIINWTAPAAGFGTVNIHSRGIAVDGFGSTGGDQQTASVLLSLTEATSISYSNASYCSAAADPTPLVSGPGAASGTFSAQPAGLSIAASTGIVDLSASIAGQTYTVTYTYNGTDTTTTQLAVIASDDASFSYSDTIFCQNLSNPTPTITGNPGGSFSSDPGLAINSSSGSIDLSQSLAGIHAVQYITNGSCPDSFTVNIHVAAYVNPSFSYTDSSFCQNAMDPIPSTAALNGIWSATAGLSIDSLSGQIDLSSSLAQQHQVIFSTLGICSDTSTQTISILSAQDASFTLPDSLFCIGQPSVQPTITGNSGGLFSSATGLELDTTSGLIDFVNSSAAMHSISYTTSGQCADVQTLFLQINNADDASFSYPASVYCQTAANPSPSFIAGGLFSAANGLSIDSLSGLLDLTASTAGSYFISYATSGNCPDTAILQLELVAPSSFSFAVSDTTICLNQGQNPIISVQSSSTGTYSATPAGLNFVNTTTGEIDLSSSTTGNYQITFQANDTCSNPAQINVALSICGGQQFTKNDHLFKVYPNPSNGTLFIQSTMPIQQTNVSLFDILGNNAYFKRIEVGGNTPLTLTFSDLPKGTYWLRLENSDVSTVFKIILD